MKNTEIKGILIRALNLIRNNGWNQYGDNRILPGYSLQAAVDEAIDEAGERFADEVEDENPFSFAGDENDEDWISMGDGDDDWVPADNEEDLEEIIPKALGFENMNQLRVWNNRKHRTETQVIELLTNTVNSIGYQSEPEIKSTYTQKDIESLKQQTKQIKNDYTLILTNMYESIGKIIEDIENLDSKAENKELTEVITALEDSIDHIKHNEPIVRALEIITGIIKENQ